MMKQFLCQKCDAVIIGNNTEEVMEKIKKHNNEVHEINEMNKEDLEKRKRMIKTV